MSYFTDDSPHKSTSEPLIVDNNNLPEPELGLWDQNVQRFIKAKNSDIATARSQNITDRLNERSQILEQELGPNYIEKLKDFGYNPGVLGAKGKDPWLSSGREETFEKAIKNLRSILPAETRGKLFAGDELEVAAAETAKQVDKETSKKLQNTKYGWWAGIFGDIGAHLTDPLEVATLGFLPNVLAGRIIAQGGKTSLASRTSVYAGTEAGVAAAFEAPNQFLNVKGYKEELGLKYSNSDAAQAVFAATVLSAVGAGAFELGAGGLRKLRTGEWGVSEYNSHVAKHYDQMSPELKHAHELVDQATENGRMNPFGDTPEGVQRHIDETIKAERFVNQEVRDVPKGDIEAAEDLAKQIKADDNELPDVQKLREEFLAEHQLAQAPKPEGDIPDGFAFLNEVANDLLPENVRVQVVDEIERAAGGSFQQKRTVAKSTSDSLTGTHIEAPTELYDWLDVKPAKFQADYTKIAKKRTKVDEQDPLSDPTQVRNHVEHVLSNAPFALKHAGGNMNLISIDGQGRLVSVDLEISKTQYKVITAHRLTADELEAKIKGAFEEHGEDGFKWKVDPRKADQRQSISGVPQEDPSSVTRSSVSGPLSVDDIIKRVRYLQGFQERAGHPSVYQLTGMHSSTVKAIDGLKQQKGTGEQFWNMIQKMPGVKKDELEWMDLENWLKEQGKVTREEVINYVNAHKIEMEETTLGGLDDVKLTEEDQAIFDKEFKSALESAEQLPPLHTDQKGISDAEVTGIRRNVMENIIHQDMDKYELAEFAEYTAPGVIHKNKYNEIAFSIPNTKKGSFEGMHFGPTNTFAHARVTSRKTASGKNVLHIEEVQSDLHQKGKSEGYLGEADIATQENLRERVRLQREQANIVRDRITEQYDAPEYQELQAVIHRAVGGGIGAKTDPESIIKLISDLKEDGSFGTHYSPSFIDKFKTTKPELHERLLNFTPYDEVKRLQELLKIQELRLSEIQTDLRRAEYGTPDLPFKGARWQELVMKRMIAKAIDEGYDGITINKGIDIARASAGRIEHFVEGEALGFKIDRSLKDPSLKIEASGRRSHTKAQLSLREVKQYFGADIAEKVKAGIEGTEEFVYSSVPKSVEVPNGGFRTSYDGALPRFISKYVKKWGAKLEQAKVLEDGSSNPYLEFTPEMKKSVSEAGQLYRFGDEGDIQGSFTPANNLVQIARSAVDPTATLRHEAIHALKNLNLFKAAEWNLLEETARQMDWIKKHDIEARYKAEFDGDEATRQRAMLEESIAEEFSKWRRGELEVTQEIKTIFEHIQALLGQIAETLRRSGITDFEDVFKRIESSEIKNRQLPELRDDIQYEIGVGTKGETVTPRELVERADYELQQAEAIGLCLKVA